MKGFIFDLDGTVYLGKKMIEGAAQAIQALKKAGHRVIFLTNKSIATRQEYVDKLNRMGIETNLEEVINSNFAVAKFLAEHLHPGEKVLVIGEEPLFAELAERKILLTTDPQQAKYVVLGWDRQFNYDKLNVACQAVLNGAKVIATNPDRSCPLEEGQIPDCGALMGALEGATGQEIDYVLGKPSPYMAKTAMEMIRLDAQDCYMIGDRLETDIRMGNEAGMNSVLVLTGITTREMVETAEFKPTYVLNSIQEITRFC